MKPLQLYICLFAVSGFMTVIAARQPYMRIGSVERMDASGIKLKVFKGAKNIPMLAVDSQTLTRSRGTAKEEITVYSAGAYWLSKQFIAKWEAPGGAITLLEMTYAVPTTIPLVYKGFVTPDAFSKWAEISPFPGMDQAEQWLGIAFGGTATLSRENVRGYGVSIKKYTISNPNYDSNKLYRELYVAESSKAPKRYIAIAYDLAATSVDIGKSRKAILTSIKSLSLAKAKLSSSKRMYSRGGGKKKNMGPDYEASRQRIISNIKNLTDWWYLETANYIIVANLKNKSTISVVQRDIERCRSSFENVFPLQQPMKAISAVRLFQGRDEYTRYVGPAHQWSGGLWMPGKKELVVSPMDHGNKKDQREQMVKVLYHEGFHQYLHYSVNEARTHLWFNEGHATFFEGLKLGSTSYKVGLVEPYVNNLRAQVKSGPVAIEQMLEMDHTVFYAKDEKARYRNYSLAYGLVYFLNKGARAIKAKNTYPEIPLRYFKTLVETGDRAAAATAAWKGVDMARFSKDFHAFWEDRSLIKRSVRYTVAKARPGLLKKLKMQPAKKGL